MNKNKGQGKQQRIPFEGIFDDRYMQARVTHWEVVEDQEYDDGTDPVDNSQEEQVQRSAESD